MQKSHPTFTPLNAYKITLTAPSNHFTLDTVLPSATNQAKKPTSAADNVAEPVLGLGSTGSMTSQRLYDCFATHGSGHFDSVDSLFDQGVWIGYLAKESRAHHAVLMESAKYLRQSSRYRGLPSYRDLEDNHKNLNFPFPTPLPDTRCSVREAVCRGCFSSISSILQLREISFGSNSKVVIMPLKGADDAGLFCIMLPQPLDRSIRSLETFRPFEHHLERDGARPFTNSYMLLAIRDRKNHSDLLRTVCETLDPTELARIAKRSGRLPPVSMSVKKPEPKPTVETVTGSEGLSKTIKRKQRQTATDDLGSDISAKRSKLVTLQGPRMKEHPIELSDDDFFEPLSIPGFRRSSSRATVQQQSPVTPSNAQKAPARMPSPQIKKIGTVRFTEEQARHIQIVWKVEFQDTEFEIRRPLSAVDTFRGLLDSYSDEAKVIPSASRQAKAGIWTVKFRLPDGSGKAVIVSATNPFSELNFEGLLRHLADKEVWKEDCSLMVEIEIGAILSSKGD